jgi:hypothetical protein
VPFLRKYVHAIARKMNAERWMFLRLRPPPRSQTQTEISPCRTNSAELVDYVNTRNGAVTELYRITVGTNRYTGQEIGGLYVTPTSQKGGDNRWNARQAMPAALSNACPDCHESGA